MKHAILTAAFLAALAGAAHAQQRPQYRETATGIYVPQTVDLYGQTLQVTGNAVIGDIDPLASPQVGLRVSPTLSGNTSQYGITANPIFDSSVSSAFGMQITRTMPDGVQPTWSYGLNINSPALSGSGSIAQNFGLHVADQTVGTVSNYAIYTGAGNVRFGDAVSITADNDPTLAVRNTTTSNAAYALFQNQTTGTTSGDGLYVGIGATEKGWIWHYENNAIGFGTNNTEVLDLTGDGDLDPFATYDVNLGSITKRYLTLHAAELWVQNLVAENVMATIGGRILVAPTNELTQAIPSGYSSIRVKYNNFADGDVWYMEGFSGATASVEFGEIFDTPLGSANPATDQFTVNSTCLSSYLPDGSTFYVAGGDQAGTWTVASTSCPVSTVTITVVEDVTSSSVTGSNIVYFDHTVVPGPPDGYWYRTFRDRDGSGANDWQAGDAVVNLGSAGDGFIDLYADHGVKAGSEYGPTIVGNVRQSITYNDWEPRWALGNLDGLYGYSGTAYGVAFGDPNASWVKIDDTSGVRLGNGVTTSVQITPAGNASFTGSVTASSGAIGGWSIGASALTSNNIGLYSGAASTARIEVGSGADTAGLNSAASSSEVTIWSGQTHASRGSAPFRVTAAGALTATSGTVGGWSLSATTLTGGNATLTNTGNLTLGTSNAVVRLSANDATYRLWAGNATAGSAPFRVTSAGALTATSATISGAITSTSGTIGGWTLASNYLTAGSAGTTVRLDSGGSNPAFSAGSSTPASAPFRVTNAGALTATNATLTGTLSAASGNVTINGSGITLASGATYFLQWSDHSQMGSNGVLYIDGPNYGANEVYITAGSRDYRWTGSAYYPYNGSTLELGRSSNYWTNTYTEDLFLGSPPTTSNSEYPLVRYSGDGQVYEKTNGSTGENCMGSGGIGSLTIHKGIVISSSCMVTPSPEEVALKEQNDWLQNRVTELENRLAYLEGAVATLLQGASATKFATTEVKDLHVVSGWSLPSAAFRVPTNPPFCAKADGTLYSCGGEK